MCRRLQCEIRSASIFRKPTEARKFGESDSASCNFRWLKFELKNPRISTYVSVHRYTFKKAPNTIYETENDIFGTSLKLSRWVPPEFSAW